MLSEQIQATETINFLIQLLRNRFGFHTMRFRYHNPYNTASLDFFFDTQQTRQTIAEDRNQKALDR